MRKVGFKNKNGFVSGEKFCGLSNTRKISSRSVECNENQMLTFLTVGKAKKPTWSECRDLCDGDNDCEFFQWKVIVIQNILHLYNLPFLFLLGSQIS